MKNEKLYTQFKNNNELNQLIRNYETDNRDLYETTLWLDTGDRVDVQVWELIENVIENTVEDEETCDKFIKSLEKLKKKIEKYTEEN